MIVNEFAGSGGDALPWYFRHVGIGQLVGKRTWGGLVGIYGYPQSDRRRIRHRARALPFTPPMAHWDVENHGIRPDIEVEFDPQPGAKATTSSSKRRSKYPDAGSGKIRRQPSSARRSRIILNIPRRTESQVASVLVAKIALHGSSDTAVTCHPERSPALF